jgi:hypothetical protein
MSAPLYPETALQYQGVTVRFCTLPNLRETQPSVENPDPTRSAPAIGLGTAAVVMAVALG